jgi:tRNA A37 threonylcarbamoyltransferase TsaD
VTGAHTELVLTRGVGLHTILGISFDIALGNCLDKIAKDLREFKDVLEDKSQIKKFVSNYNKNRKSN